MPVPTPELGLSQAVDADDTADYLVTNLANSLVSVDALFNNTSGHTHGGVHQGGPITSIPASAIPLGSITSAMIADGTIQSADLANGAITSAKISPPIDIGGMFRSTGQIGMGEGPGAGVEMYWNGTTGFIQAVDRGTGLWSPMDVGGSQITLSINAASAFVLNSSGNVTMTGALTVGGNITTSSYLFLTDNTHFVSASAANMVYAVPSGGIHIFEYNTGGYAPVSTGPLTVTGVASVTAGLTGTTAAFSGTLTGTTATFSSTVTAAELILGPAYFLPVGNSLRYAVGTNGYHSFELAGGGPANVACGDLSATGNLTATGSLTFNGAFQGGAVEAIGGTHKMDWQVVVNGTVYRIQLWQ